MKLMTVSALVLTLVGGAAMAVPQPQPAAKQPAKIQPAPSEGDKKKDDAPASLKVGDKAPAITVDSWIKGEAVKSFEPGKVYVVEFWATWCGPCIASIPHLTKLQKEHPELTIIGVAASERVPQGKDGKPAADNRLEKLKDFVAKQGKEMDYRVAYDSKRAMSKDWMQAAKQNGIPCAFIVGHDGKLAYIGHPGQMDGEISKALKAASDAKKTASR